MNLWEGNVLTGVCHMVGATSWAPWTYPSPGPHPQLVTSGGDHWRPVQTCSSQDLPSPLRATCSGGN